MSRRKGRHVWGNALFAVLLLAVPRVVLATEALVAVAANFVEPARALAAAFAGEGGGRVEFSSGSTGALFAQISHGAPFDIFLAAGDREPAQLAASGLAVAETRFTYAIGSLVLWSADAKRVGDDCAAVLKAGAYRRLAIANPDLAPYGAAAKASLQAWRLWGDIAPRLLRAENVGQVFQFVSTGNAELGFLARSQVLDLPKDRAGSYCVVDPALYPPIRQQGILLRHGENNAVARQFLRFLQGTHGQAMIRGFGYEVEAVPQKGVIRN
jgi:molybdate transport system substrate-binding protein